MYTKLVLIFIVLYHYSTAYEIRNNSGAPCSDGKFTGVCKTVTECQYAHQLINVDHKKPPGTDTCGFLDKTPMACCPTQNLLHQTGVFQKFFMASNEGVIRTNNMTCRYEGKQPFICCQDEPEVKEPPENKNCPALPAPKLGDKNHFLWTKCLSYQRYIKKCVVSNDDPNSYFRQDLCGIPKNVPRLSGGVEAEAKQFPHMAVVGCHNTVKLDDKDIIWVGGGSLISEKFILTAAHVLAEAQFGIIRYALLGTVNKKDPKSGLLCNVIRTIAHKCHDRNSKMHDIALLKLHERVKFNEFIRPICLPLDGMIIEKTLWIAGWGETNALGKSTDVLLTTTVLENRDLCKKMFSTFYPDTMICGDGDRIDGNHDTCRGDSGGPLMGILKNINCTYVITGIVSYGYQCREERGGAGVYTNATVYLDWIMENVWPTEYAKLKANSPPKNVDNCGMEIKNQTKFHVLNS